MIPPRRILAAVDFSQASRSALAFASQLAGYADAELDVLHALHPALTDAAAALGSDLVARTRLDLESVTRAVCPGERRRRLHVVGGEAAPVICDIARREQADIVVLGIHGVASRHDCGETAAAVIRRVGLPTMFVPESWHPPGRLQEPVALGPVIAAVDEGVPSAAAAAAAASLASLLHARLEMIHVLEEPVAEALADRAVPDGHSSPILVMGRRTHPDTASPGSTVLGVVSAARAPVLMYLPEDDAAGVTGTADR